MKIIAVIFWFCVFIPARAQRKINFNSRNYIGLLEGENGSAFQVETTNGISYRSWFAGLGTGLDWYYIRSIPLFGSLSKSFLEKNNRSFFISTDIGINFPWTHQYYHDWNYGGTEKYYNGLYLTAGIGYKTGIGKKSDAILLQLGYSYKHTKERVFSNYPCLVCPNSETTSIYNFYLRRLSLRAGWGF